VEGLRPARLWPSSAPSGGCRLQSGWRPGDSIPELRGLGLEVCILKPSMGLDGPNWCEPLSL
jgi:hypothetical protein